MAVKRERMMVRRTCRDLYLDHRSVRGMIEELQGYLDEYGDSTRIECETDSYGDTSWFITMEELESKEEMLVRVEHEERREMYGLERERREYERLKAKFGG